MPNNKNHKDQGVWKELENGSYLTIQRYTQDKALDFGTKDNNQVVIQRRNIRSQNLEINQTAYHEKYGYVVLERDNNVQAKIDMGSNLDLSQLPNSWECIILNKTDQKIDQQLKSEEPKKVNIQASEFTFLIQIETVCTIENQVTIQKHKVHIKDPILSLIQPMKKLYLCELEGFYLEKELDFSKTFIQEQIKNNQQIVLHGIRTDKNLDGDQTKFFQRFQNCEKQGGWGYYGVMDGIKILCQKSIIFYGVGIFEQSDTDSPKPFTLEYKYSIIDQYGSDIYESNLIIEDVQYSSIDVNEFHFFKYKFKKFPKGIKVQAGQTIQYRQKVSMSKMFYSITGIEYDKIQNPDMDIFKLGNAESSQTTVSKGLIPGFLYQLY
ncbi:UNKNOWN [Stylonychia lemnae]|uniref:PHR domain-containing protein n=1 Tax=Stylonychia lemnae TaxID=5949 RepID=A0A077ZN43_STYLE|nr:UNKNOWN [Stylonychia lemnae]|eukprot:CDW71397.1 UNKNOWN [Stylonychia lemnae]